jgi:hypothetical protein
MNLDFESNSPAGQDRLCDPLGRIYRVKNGPLGPDNPEDAL